MKNIRRPAALVLLIILALSLGACQTEPPPEPPPEVAETVPREPAKFEPEDGIIYTGAGQSPIAVMQMINTGSDARKPVIAAAYDGLSDLSRYFIPTEIFMAHNYYPGAMLQIGLALPYSNDEELLKLSDGTYDDKIRVLAGYYGSIPGEIFLRIGYECEGSWNGYRPDLYVAAFRRIVDIFREEGVDNIAYVWNLSAAYTDQMKYYPGDEYVDWWSFNFWNIGGNIWYLELAESHGKPVMIGESSKQYAEFSEEWFETYFSVINQPGVKGFQYINWYWDTTSMWDWGDSRYTAQERWVDIYNAEMENPQYISRGSEYYNPIAVYVQPGRAHLGPDIDGTPWDPVNDEYTVREGYGYEFENARHVSTYGYVPGVSPASGGFLKVIFTVPEGTHGIVEIQDMYFAEKDVYVGDRLALNMPSGAPSAKFTYYASDIVDGRLEISLRQSGRWQFEVSFAGIQSVSASAPATPSALKSEPAPSGAAAFSWKPVPGATHYNVYRDGWLIAVTEQAFYTDSSPEAGGGSLYTVSGWNKFDGEGLLAPGINI